MTDAFDLWDLPTASEVALIAGWHQWADAGNVSSGLPEYLIQTLEARKIGSIQPEGFYLFQMPGTHHFFRPEIKLKEGHVESIQERKNEFYYWNNGDKGLVIFLGQEPHLNVDRYCDALMDAAEELGVRRILSLGGVYGSMPYDRDREIHAVYSLPAMHEVLRRFEIHADHAVFGHVHRAGPAPSDDRDEWVQPPGPMLHNTGSWVYEPLLLAGAQPPHPYWPGGAVLIENGNAPRQLRLLDDVPVHALQP